MVGCTPTPCGATAKKKKSKDKGGDAKPKQADQLQQKLQDLAFRKLWDKEVATSRIKELEETIKRLEDKEHFYDTVSKQLITERERRKQNQKALEISQANEKRLSEDLKILRKERMLDQKTWEKMKTEMEDMHARDVKNREQAYQDLQEKYSKYSQFEPTEVCRYSEPWVPASFFVLIDCSWYHGPSSMNRKSYGARWRVCNTS